MKKILWDIRVTVTFQRTFQPSAGLSYCKIGTRQMCMKWLPIIRHVNSVKQCRTVLTVSTKSTVSTVIARCYLHLRWYFFFYKLLFLLMQSMLGSVLPLAIVSWQWWYQFLKKTFNDVTFEDPRERFAVCFRWVSGDEAIWETRELRFWWYFITFLLLMISYCPWDDEVWILEESWLDFYEEILRGWGSLLSHSWWGNRGRTGRSHLGTVHVLRHY